MKKIQKDEHAISDLIGLVKMVLVVELFKMGLSQKAIGRKLKYDNAAVARFLKGMKRGVK